MENSKHFSTRTDQRWYAGCSALICLGLGIAAAVGMWLWLRIAGAALLVGGVLILMAPVMMLTLGRQQNIRLEFSGDELCIYHFNGQTYEIYDIPASDFICRQNFLEKRYDVGRIQVRNTIFYFYGVQNYAETCRYIQDNFPNH